MAYKWYKKIDLICTISSAAVVAGSSIAIAISLNPTILSLAAAGILLKSFAEVKNYKRSIEMARFSYTSFQTALDSIKSFLRGLPFDEKMFLDELKHLDDVIIDISIVIPDKFEKKYNELFC